MKFTKLVGLSTLTLMMTQAVAHEVWVESDHTHGGEILKANLGYEDFPELKPIAADRTHIFKKPLQLVTAQGIEDLVPVKDGKSYEFASKKVVKDGSYLVLAEYSPTFWSENKDGWKQVDMKAMPDATYCEQTQMFGKNVVNVGHHANAKDIVTKPVGQGLEIVPLDNPANARVGEPFEMKVLFNGEPLANETVVGTFEGFVKKDPADKVHKLEPQAFSDTTRNDGTVKLCPLIFQWENGSNKSLPKSHPLTLSYGVPPSLLPRHVALQWHKSATA